MLDFENIQQAFDFFESLCDTCEKQGCCKRCISDHLRNILVQSRGKNLSILELCSLIKTNYEGGSTQK